MNEKEWDDLAEQIVNRLKPRLDPKWVPGIESEMAGGEYAMAVEDLIAILVDDQVEVTEQDKRDLELLAPGTDASAEDLDRLLVALPPLPGQ